LLRIAAKAIAAIIGMLLAATLAVTALVLAAATTGVPALFVSTGVAVFALGAAGTAWLVAGRASAHRRRTTLAAAVAGALLAAYATGVPLNDPRTAAEPVQRMQFADLPTGSRIAWVRIPATGREPAAPVVFVHGGPGVADMSHDLSVFATLAADGHDVILYDQVGAGHSGRLEDPRQYTLRRDLADFEALLEELELQRPILIGHSYGSTLIAAYMARHPDAASALVFLAPGAIRPGGEQYLGGMRDRLSGDQQVRLYSKTLEPRALLGYLVTLVNPAATRAWIGDAEMDARFDILYGLTSPGLACEPETDLPQPHQLGFFTNARTRTIPDLRPELARVAVPTLILKPQCDYLPWSFGTDIATAIDGSQLVYVRGAGHSLYFERQAEVMREIRAFLGGEPLPIAAQSSLEPPPDLDGPIGDVEQ
jgi:proline iminopeptidase